MERLGSADSAGRENMRLTPEAQRAVDFCTYCPRLCHFACPAAHGDASEASTAWGLSLIHI